jgi:hypothetical protein
MPDAVGSVGSNKIPPHRLPGRSADSAPKLQWRINSHETSSDWRGGGCRARIRRACLGATSQSVRWEPDGHAGPEPRRARADTVQRRCARAEAIGFKLHPTEAPCGNGARGNGARDGGADAGQHLGDTTGPPPCSACLACQNDASRRQGDAIDRHQRQPAQPGRAGTPAVGQRVQPAGRAGPHPVAVALIALGMGNAAKGGANPPSCY